jgi:hypothetical protein
MYQKKTALSCDGLSMASSIVERLRRGAFFARLRLVLVSD